MKIQESGEMYLETILILSKKGGSVQAQRQPGAGGAA